jgi:hypothetical protein
LRPSRSQKFSQASNPEQVRFITQNSVFIWIALATGAILLTPLVAMQFTTEVNWDETDFITMGSVLFAIASLFVLAARRAPRRRHANFG